MPIYNRLTDRQQASGVTLNDIIHVVITSDQTQSPQGSSFYAPLSFLQPILSGASGTSGTSGSSGISGLNGIDGSNSRRWGGLNTALAPNIGGITFRNVGGSVTLDPSLIANIRANEIDSGGSDMTNWFNALDSYTSTNVGKAYVQITDSFDQTIFGIYEVGNVGYNVAGYWQIGTTLISSSAPTYNFSSTTLVTLSWVLFGADGTSGVNGTSGLSGTSGSNGTSGTSGSNGTSGSSGTNGSSGTSGVTGSSGTSGTSGVNGTSGTSGVNGTSGTSGSNGTSGSSGTNGSSGSSGTNGVSGTSGTSGTSGSNGVNGTSGTSGTSGSSGTSGTNGSSGTSGVSVGGALGYWGSFWSTQDQQVGSTLSAYTITYNNTDPDSNGVSIVSNSQITFANAGVYNIQFSAQVDRTSGSGTDTVDIWFRKNGIDIPESNTTVTVAGGASAAKTVAAWNYMLELAANDYIELAWRSSDLNLELIHEAAATSPTRPAIPSVIATAQQVLNLQQGTSGTSGTSGINGTSGVNGTSGTSGSSGTSSTTAQSVLTVQTTVNSSFYPTFVDSDNVSPGQQESFYTNDGLSYNPSTNTLDVTGSIENGDGSGDFPSYSFISDTNTGIYRIGTDNIGIATGGVLRLSADSNGRVLIGNGNESTGSNFIFPIGNSAQTADNTPTTLLTLSTTTNNVYTVEVFVAGKDLGTQKGVGGVLTATFVNDTGVLTLVGTAQGSVQEDFGSPSPTFTLVNSGTDIILEVTGVVATDILWYAKMRYLAGTVSP